MLLRALLRAWEHDWAYLELSIQGHCFKEEAEHVELQLPQVRSVLA